MVHPTAKVCEQMNGNMHARNTLVQRLALHINVDSHSAHRQMDGQTGR